MKTTAVAIPDSAHGLSPLELKRKVKVKEAAALNGVCEDTFKRNYKHLIKKIGPRRLVVALDDAINLPPPPRPP